MDKMQLFVDFDGTISSRDVVDAVLEKFARKEWLDVERQWQAGRIGSRECLTRQVNFIVAEEAELTSCVDSIGIDASFEKYDIGGDMKCHVAK